MQRYSKADLWFSTCSVRTLRRSIVVGCAVTLALITCLPKATSLRKVTIKKSDAATQGERTETFEIPVDSPLMQRLENLDLLGRQPVTPSDPKYYVDLWWRFAAEHYLEGPTINLPQDTRDADAPRLRSSVQLASFDGLAVSKDSSAVQANYHQTVADPTFGNDYWKTQYASANDRIQSQLSQLSALRAQVLPSIHFGSLRSGPPKSGSLFVAILAGLTAAGGVVWISRPLKRQTECYSVPQIAIPQTWCQIRRPASQQIVRFMSFMSWTCILVLTLLTQL